MEKYVDEHSKINLIDPTQQGQFVTHSDELYVQYPELHAMFTANKIEKFRPLMKFPLPPHRKPNHDFLFVTDGLVTRSLGLDSYTIKKNTFCFLPAFQILSDENMSENVKGYYVHFNKDVFAGRFFQKNPITQIPFFKLDTNPMVEIPPELTPRIIFILGKLEQQYILGAPNGTDIIGMYLLALFLELEPHFDHNQNLNTNSSSKITQDFKELLVENIYMKQKVSDYASMLSISPNHLNRCVKETLGRTARDVLFDMFVLEAKVLLKQSSLNISEIAYRLGNRDASDFSRLFKKRTNMTPKKYRTK